MSTPATVRVLRRALKGRRGLQTASEVIDALGGTAAVARLTGKSMQSVSNWRTDGLPPASYVVLSLELARRGKAAPASLWRMIASTEG